MLIRFSHSKIYKPWWRLLIESKLSIIIIPHTKTISIKHFCIQKNIEVETRWQINKPSNIFCLFYLFYVYIYTHTYIYMSTYVYTCTNKYTYSHIKICVYAYVCFRGVMVNALDCRFVVREFELQSRNYVHFRTNILGKVVNPPIYRLTSITNFLPK